MFWYRFTLTRVSPILASALLLMTCQDEEEVFRSYPVLETLQVGQITLLGARFSAEIVSRGNQPIDNLGFVWGRFKDLEVERDYFVLLGISNESTFTYDLKSSLKEGVKYYVRAFVVTGGLVVYGKAVTFTSYGSEGPRIEALLPQEGLVGDTIHILGRNFSQNKKFNFVEYGDVPAEIVSSSDTLLVTIVPPDIRSAKLQVTVSLDGNIHTAPNQFTVPAPILGDWAPIDSYPCDTIEIALENISLAKPSLRAYYNDGLIPYRYDHQTKKIKFRLNFLTTAQVSIRIEHFLFTVSKEYSINHNMPVMVGYYPDQFGRGDSIQFTLQNLPLCVPADLLLNYEYQSPASYSRGDNHFKFKLPNVCENEVNVILRTSYGDFSQTLTFPPIDFLLSCETPSATFDEWVTLTGTDFIRNEPFNIFLGGELCSEVQIISETELMFKVPQNLTTAGEAIDIISDGCRAADTLRGAFSFPPLEIYGVSPTTVQSVFETITLSATYLSPIDELNYVLINDNYASTDHIRFHTPTPNQVEVDARALVEMYGTDVNTTVNFRLEVAGMLSGYSDPVTVLIQDPWEEMSDFSAFSSSAMASFSLQGRGYILLGDNNLTEVWRYTPQLDQWTRMSDFPGESRRFPISFAFDDFAYVGFGWVPGDDESSYRNDFWKYDPAIDNWTLITDSPPFVRRRNPIYFTLNGKGYYGGGNNHTENFNDFWEFDHSLESWSPKSDAPYYTPQSIISFTKDGFGYFLGSSFIGSDYFFGVYDPDLDSWSTVNSTQSCIVCSSVTVGNNVLATDPRNNTAWLVRPGRTPPSDEWKNIPFPGEMKQFPFLFVIDGIAYCGLGANGDSVWSFNMNNIQ